MKIPSFFRTAGVAALALSFAAAVPQTVEARDKGPKFKHVEKHRDHDRGRGHGRDWDRDRDRRSYISYPSSNFTITFGNGYRGRGYYYGPRGASYFYERPGVRFYSSRSLVPSHYWGGGRPVMGYSRTEALVQRELAQRGFYRGPIDGDIGPGSRAAIARYQSTYGLPVTGSITSSLLHSLGLR